MAGSSYLRRCSNYSTGIWLEPFSSCIRLSRTSSKLETELAPNQGSHRMLVQRNIRRTAANFQNTAAGWTGIGEHNQVLAIWIFKSRVQHVASVALRIDAVRPAFDELRIVREGPVLSA